MRRLPFFVVVLLTALNTYSQTFYTPYRYLLIKAGVKETLTYSLDSTGKRYLKRHEWLNDSAHVYKYVAAGKNNGVMDTAFEYATVIVSECDKLNRPIVTRKFTGSKPVLEHTLQYLPDGRIIKSYTRNKDGHKWNVIVETVGNSPTETYTEYRDGETAYQRVYTDKGSYWLSKFYKRIDGVLQLVAKGKDYVDNNKRIIKSEFTITNRNTENTTEFPALVIYKRAENGLVLERELWAVRGNEASRKVEYYEYITRP